MQVEVKFAGFGGQGIMIAGKFLALAAMEEGKNVVWIPSYGPEMRGGTANVTVILSNDRVSSPVLNEYDTAILLNQQSIDKFESRVKEGGCRSSRREPNSRIMEPAFDASNLP